MRVGGMRRQVFSEKYMASQKNLIDEHKKAFGGDLPKGGYPDMGNGKIAANLSYKDWYLFQCAQRSHYQLIEWIASVLIFLLISGIFFPLYASYGGVAWIVGRELYTYGYMNNGPSGRMIGATLADIAALVLFGFGVYGCLQTTGLISK